MTKLMVENSCGHDERSSTFPLWLPPRPPCGPHVEGSTYAHYSLLTASCSLLTTHCSLLTAHCSLLTAHCSLLTAHCSLLTAHCSLLTTHYTLLTAHCMRVAQLEGLRLLLTLAACYFPLAQYHFLLHSSFLLHLLLTTRCSLLTTHYQCYQGYLRVVHIEVAPLLDAFPPFHQPHNLADTSLGYRL